MLRAGVNRLRGQVHLRAECAFPERVLNLCGARGLAFWDLEWESPAVFRCWVSRRDWSRLRRAAEKLDCTLTVLERQGAPFALGRLRRRTALAVGAVACALALFLGSFFIWDFTVEGNETVPEERILRGLERCGVGLGSFGLGLDSEDIRNHLLLEIPELSWVAVNVSGCRATVQVRERIPPPTLIDERTPANIVARRAGLVLEVQALQGVQSVLPGASVTEGQLLISGVEDMDTFGARLTAASGSVRARTWYTLTTRLPLTVQQKVYTGREKTAVALVVGRQRIKFFANSSIEGAEYDKITQRAPLSLLGIPLPVTVVAERYRFYETKPVSPDPLTLRKQGEAALTEHLRALVEPWGEVKSILCDARQRGEGLEVVLSAECVEEIGAAVPLFTEEANVRE